MQNGPYVFFSHYSIGIQYNKVYTDVSPCGGKFGRAKKNVIITLCIVAVAFIICWTPASITYSLYNFGYPYDLTSDMHSVFLTLVLCNLSVNPVVYGFKYHEFRRQIKQMVCPSARVGNDSSDTSESTA